MDFGLARRMMLVDRGVVVGTSIIGGYVVGCLVWSAFQTPISVFMRDQAGPPLDWLLWLANPVFSAKINGGTAAMILVGMGLSLHRFAWWRYAGIVAIIAALVGFQGSLARINHAVANTFRFDLWWVGVWVPLARNLLTAGLIGLLARSMFVCTTVAIASVVPFAFNAWVILNMPVDSSGGRAVPSWFSLQAPVFQGVIAIGVLMWAIRSRRKNVPASVCVFCGHDLGTRPDHPCPECGGKPPVAAIR